MTLTNTTKPDDVYHPLTIMKVNYITVGLHLIWSTVNRGHMILKAVNWNYKAYKEIIKFTALLSYDIKSVNLYVIVINLGTLVHA